MQSFEWQFQYSAIFFIWCIGYLEHPELVTFLKKAQSMLLRRKQHFTRHNPPESLIFILDNVRDENEEIYKDKGQLIRSEQEIETAISESLLQTFKKSPREAMPAPYKDVMLWALF